MSNITNWQNSRNESFLIVRVEKDAYGFIIQRAHLLYSRTCDWQIGYGVIFPQSKMAKNVAKYTLILDLDNSTDEQAMHVVDSKELIIKGINQGLKHKDYTQQTADICEWFEFPDSSLNSLVRSLKLDTENYNHVFLKIEQ